MIVAVLTLLTINSLKGDIVRIYMQDGVHGCGEWCTAVNEGKSNGYHQKANGDVDYVDCDDTEGDCFTIGRDCELGKWYIDINLNSLYFNPQPTDTWFEIYWDEENEVYNFRESNLAP